jgi:hypothetical protein
MRLDGQFVVVQSAISQHIVEVLERWRQHDVPSRSPWVAQGSSSSSPARIDELKPWDQRHESTWPIAMDGWHL